MRGSGQPGGAGRQQRGDLGRGDGLVAVDGAQAVAGERRAPSVRRRMAGVRVGAVDAVNVRVFAMVGSALSRGGEIGTVAAGAVREDGPGPDGMSVRGPKTG